MRPGGRGPTRACAGFDPRHAVVRDNALSLVCGTRYDGRVMPFLRPYTLHLRAGLLGMALVFAGCTSNPTPHPGSDDTYNVGETDTAVGNADTAGQDDNARQVCVDVGGVWDGDSSQCEVALESVFDGADAAPPAAGTPMVNVTAIGISGEAGSYTFNVSLLSNDVDCTSYADWWEVVLFDGSLVHRRILAHPHVNEQPFARSGGPVAVDADEWMVIRGHREPEGYVGRAIVGTVSGGFVQAELPSKFATTLEDVDPQPTSCADQ
ncbi:MAG: hypothetical protein ACI9MR_001007 [Myxococcota bacterium]|jgi:hypothetical protein